MSESVPSSPIVRLLKTLSFLPFSWVRGLGRLVGFWGLRFDRRTRKAIDQNLALCLPEMDKEQRMRIRNSRLRHIGQTFAEMSHVWTKPAEDILAMCREGKGSESFRNAVAAEGGVIVLAPHIGNWEIMNIYINSIRPLTAMYRPSKDPSLDAFILAARERSGSVLVPTDRRGVLQTVKTLKSDGVVGMLPDQVPGQGSGEFAPFFGHQAYTMTLASQLARKTGASVFVVGALQTSKGFEIVSVEVDEDFYSEDIKTSVKGLNASVERLVRVRPEQYQWEYKRFKLQPDGALSLYKEHTS
ncbi:lysophospholipid acyltransferase family protein [Rhodanobacter aciditrophus]|uniref:Lysophospholipid acyltransferase family protein n=1 Tax=Rhodanobacter aciditrophus TaxID=1623218 RepID=A0ABW4B0C9_9GAMM